MNYYMPFQNLNPYSNLPIKPSIFKRIFSGKINLTNILTNTQKTLNIINQTIPVIKQVKPVVDNAKTMFRVMNEFKKIDLNTKQKEKNLKIDNEITKEEKQQVIKETNINNPTFFL